MENPLLKIKEILQEIHINIFIKDKPINRIPFGKIKALSFFIKPACIINSYGFIHTQATLKLNNVK